MSGPIAHRKRDPEDARIAIDSYLDAIPRMPEEHEHFQFAIRALDLAVLIGDAVRTERSRKTLMGSNAFADNSSEAWGGDGGEGACSERPARGGVAHIPDTWKSIPLPNGMKWEDVGRGGSGGIVAGR